MLKFKYRILILIQNYSLNVVLECKKIVLCQSFCNLKIKLILSIKIVTQIL
jgi:hypothetical protein